MSRRPRRPPAEPPFNPTTCSYQQALKLEVVGWPSWRERRLFWSRPEIPQELRPAARPDPRVLLKDGGPSERQANEHTQRVRDWRAARLDWLRKAVADAEAEPVAFWSPGWHDAGVIVKYGGSRWLCLQRGAGKPTDRAMDHWRRLD